MKVIDASEVGKLIKDGDMVAISGSGGSGSAESVIRAIRDSFINTGHPKDIGVTCGISPGNLTEDEVNLLYSCSDVILDAHYGILEEQFYEDGRINVF